jgi:hypothetical protein
VSPIGRIILVLVLVAIVAVAALLVLRPAPITGVNDNALGASVGTARDRPCREAQGERWRCTVTRRGGAQGEVELWATVDWWGCWKATPRPSGRGQVEREGCITLLDYIP